MQIRDYWIIIAKRWWILLLFIAVAGGAAYGFSKTQQPVYRSSTKLYVTPARPDYGVTLVIQNLLRQYSQQLGSDRFLGRVANDLRLDLPPGDLRRKVTVGGAAENLVIQVDVDDPNPVTAQRIARALAVAFIENHQVRMATIDPRDRIDVEMYDDPQPGALDKPKTRVNVMAGVVFGLLLGAITVFLIEYMDDTIKDSNDVERYIAMPVVGSIPRLAPSKGM
ncbi:MAG: hypothetical protein HYX88_03475 [Chloroflexi bacterium]|nr:hypothetical protein [Chloroflexota bacterium]